jgi:hypothetical protein
VVAVQAVQAQHAQLMELQTQEVEVVVNTLEHPLLEQMEVQA